MPVAYRDPEGADQFSQAVGFRFRDQSLGEVYCAEGLSLEIISQPAEFGPEDPVIKLGIMGNQDTALCDFHDTLGHFVEFWCCPDHFRADACEFLHIGLYIPFRIHQAYEGVHDAETIKSMDGNLCNGFLVVFAPGSFYVQYRIHAPQAF